MDESSEVRLRRLEDLEEIRLLLATYSKHLDAGDFAGYAGLFAQDGELDTALGTASGPAAIQELLESRLSGEEARRRTAYHVISNPIIEVDGDHATARALWTYVSQSDAGHPVIFQAGRYEDELVREGGRWKLKRHAITREMGFSPVTDGAPAVTTREEG
jgi:ketosteroid isomerase-like protein